MGRTPIELRDARPEDAAVLAVIWKDSLRRGNAVAQCADVLQVIRDVANGSGRETVERIVVAEIGDQVVGAMLIQLRTLSPVNLEPTVFVHNLYVDPDHRRHGVGIALMDAAVCFAEDNDTEHVVTLSPANSRDANRFMARLAFGSQAMVRIAATPAVRARISAARPKLPSVVATRNPRSNARLTQVLAARRSMRRQQARRTA